MKFLSTDGQKRECLKDATAFANAGGGYLIFGIEETSGIPVCLNGLPKGLADSAVNTLRQVLFDDIRPRIPGLDIAVVEPPEGANEQTPVVIALKVPASQRRPHMVMKKDYRFWIREANGANLLDVDELRDLFVRPGAAGVLAALRHELRRNIERPTRAMWFGIPFEQQMLDRVVEHLPNLPDDLVGVIERVILMTAEYNTLATAEAEGNDRGRVSIQRDELAEKARPHFQATADLIETYLRS